MYFWRFDLASQIEYRYNENSFLSRKILFSGGESIIGISSKTKNVEKNWKKHQNYENDRSNSRSFENIQNYFDQVKRISLSR